MLIDIFGGLKVKTLLTNLQKTTKQNFFVFISSIVTFNLEMISNKSFLTSNLTFSNPENTLFCFKFQEKFL